MDFIGFIYIVIVLAIVVFAVKFAWSVVAKNIDPFKNYSVPISHGVLSQMPDIDPSNIVEGERRLLWWQIPISVMVFFLGIILGGIGFIFLAMFDPNLQNLAYTLLSH